MISFSSQGSMSNNPTNGLSNQFGKTLSGILGAINNTGLTSLASNTQTQPNMSYASSGTNPGMLPSGVNTSSQQKTVKTDMSGNTTTTHPAQSNPSVLAQQQALNKLGAGLVEDGIAGPKTSAAIVKYGTPGITSTSTTSPVPTQAPKSTTTPLTVSGQIPGVLNSGQQTSNEAQTQQGVLSAGQTTADERAFQQQYTDSVKGNQFGQLAPYAEASMYAGKTPEQLQGLVTAPDLVGRASADNGLYNTLGNAYGTAALAGLTAAQTSAARNLTANQSAYTGAQNQAGRATGAGENVLGAVAPLANTPYALNPATGDITGGGGSAEAAVTQAGRLAGLQSGAAAAAGAGGNISAQQQVQVAGYQSSLQQGQNLQSQLSDLIQTFGLNPNDLNVANTGLQKIAQNVSDPHYQQLQNYINDIANTYAQILVPPGGSATDTSRGIATGMLNSTASGTSILDTMKSLDQAAQAKIAGVYTSGSGINTPDSSTGGSIYNF